MFCLMSVSYAFLVIVVSVIGVVDLRREVPLEVGETIVSMALRSLQVIWLEATDLLISPSA